MNFFRTTDTTDTTIWKPGFKLYVTSLCLKYFMQVGTWILIYLAWKETIRIILSWQVLPQVCPRQWHHHQQLQWVRPQPLCMWQLSLVQRWYILVFLFLKYLLPTETKLCWHFRFWNERGTIQSYFITMIIHCISLCTGKYQFSCYAVQAFGSFKWGAEIIGSGRSRSTNWHDTYKGINCSLVHHIRKVGVHIPGGRGALIYETDRDAHCLA